MLEVVTEEVKDASAPRTTRFPAQYALTETVC